MLLFLYLGGPGYEYWFAVFEFVPSPRANAGIVSI